MTSLSYRDLTASLLVFLGFVSFASSLPAATSQSLELKRDGWSKNNRYSTGEAFHSKGSYGFHLGLGAVLPQKPHDESLREEDDKASDPSGRLMISKGTPWPVDLGASFGVPGGQGSMQAGAHIQWTVFENFQLPSVALRGSHSVLRHVAELEELKTQTLELGVSYGVIRYLIISASVGKQWESGKTRAKEQYLTLTSSELPDWTEERTVYSWGVTISPMTPFVQLGYEQTFWDSAMQVSLAKVSFLL